MDKSRATRGTSLSVEAIELGFWAVLATLFPPEGENEEANISNFAKDEIGARFQPNAKAVLDNAVSLRAEVRRGRKVTISLGKYEAARQELANTNEIPSKPGSASWPPGAQTVAARLGESSWAQALTALGISTVAQGRARGSGRLKEEDFTTALQDFLKDCEAAGASATYTAYEQWVKSQRATGRLRPAASTVRQRYQTWSAALSAAAEPPKPKKP